MLKKNPGDHSIHSTLRNTVADISTHSQVKKSFCIDPGMLLCWICLTRRLEKALTCDITRLLTDNFLQRCISALSGHTPSWNTSCVARTSTEVDTDMMHGMRPGRFGPARKETGTANYCSCSHSYTVTSPTNQQSRRPAAICGHDSSPHDAVAPHR